MRLVAFALVCSVSATAVAAAPSLREAQSAYADDEYDKALALLDQATHEAPDDDEWVSIHELMAIIHAIFDQRDETRDAMLRILERRPRYSPPELSAPKILEAYGAARAIYERSHPAVEMSIAPPAQPIYSRWWFWAGAAGAVAIGALAIFAATSQDAPSSDLGTVKF